MNSSLNLKFALMMETELPNETLVNTYKTKLRHNPYIETIKIKLTVQ